MRTPAEVHERLESVIRWFNRIPDDDTDDTPDPLWEEEPGLAEGELRALAWVLAIPLEDVYRRLPIEENPDPGARTRTRYLRRKQNGH